MDRDDREAARLARVKERNKEYREKNIKRIPLDVQRTFYEKIAAAADKHGVPVNTYIKSAIEEMMDRECGQDVVKLRDNVIDDITSNQESINNVLVPALFNNCGNIEPLIRALLDGTDLGKTADMKLSIYGSNYKLSHTLFDLWEENSAGHYTLDDVPEWIYEGLSRDALYAYGETISKYSENTYDFNMYRDELHFTKIGYIKLIVWLEEKRIIPSDVKEKWISELYR